jgi:hypothetical protein
VRILREMGLATASQAQTAEAFGFKWKRRESYDSLAMLAAIREWLIQRYRLALRSGAAGAHSRRRMRLWRLRAGAVR